MASRRHTAFRLGCIGTWVATACMAVIFGLHHSRLAAIQSRCDGRMHFLSIALRAYADRYGRFPPAVTFDEQGRPIQSWRAVVFFCDGDCPLEGYKVTEPWNSVNNRAAADVKSHRVQLFASRFQCDYDGVDERCATDYFLLNKEQVAPVLAVLEQEGISHSMAVGDAFLIECANTGIYWAEPCDIAIASDLAVANNNIVNAVPLASADKDGPQLINLTTLHRVRLATRKKKWLAIRTCPSQE